MAATRLKVAQFASREVIDGKIIPGASDRNTLGQGIERLPVDEPPSLLYVRYGYARRARERSLG
jgi:hypothetical protein